MKKMILLSNNVCYGPTPEIGSEIEQRLTVNSKGQVWFSGHNYNGDFIKFPLGRKVQKHIQSETAKKLLCDVLSYFKNIGPFYATDGGCYELTLFFDDGKSEKITASLLCKNREMKDLCDSIRKEIGINDLLLFDGNQSDGD